MAQTEDTELRDLVVEALEKNGSLAKIRALLRANIFLAFEDECENQKQNESLDKVLNQPEGKLALCIIHEFLEFCNLKNTLFVYKSESRQGREYTYKSEDILNKLNVPKVDRHKEPILLTILKNVIKFFSNKYNLNDKPQPKGDYKDEENCTYIVHEDTSSTSSSQSDNSADEKNKINLRLPLDNSDTDTSSDSIRDKNSSEYMPNSQNLTSDIKTSGASNNIALSAHNIVDKGVFSTNTENKKSDNCLEQKNFNSSTESTSYMELRPVQNPQEVLSNSAGSPLSENRLQRTNQNYSSGSQNESTSSVHTISNTNNIKKVSRKECPTNRKSGDDSGLNDTEVMEYSYDFSPPNSDQKTSTENRYNSPKSIHSNNPGSAPNNSSSSISTSDVADLLSEKSFKSFTRDNKNDSNTTNKSRLSSPKRRFSPNRDSSKVNSDQSSDFSESSIPSLSNLSLEIHSE